MESKPLPEGFGDNWIVDSLTGDRMYVDKPLTNMQKATNLAVSLRDQLEYAEAYKESVDQTKLIEEIEKIIHLLQSSN